MDSVLLNSIRIAITFQSYHIQNYFILCMGNALNFYIKEIGCYESVSVEFQKWINKYLIKMLRVSILILTFSTIALSLPSNNGFFCLFIDKSPSNPALSHDNIPYKLVASSDSYTPDQEITGSNFVF